MIGLSARQAAERMGVNLKSFFRVVGPMMIENGDAVMVGGRYVILADRFARWERYAAERDRRVATGEWSYTRPWSLEDMTETTRRTPIVA